MASLDHLRGHELLPQDLREKLPVLYSQESLGLEAVALVKFFTPRSNWTWYVTEFDQVDTCFGLVNGFELELGYFSLSELDSVRDASRMPAIERDLYYAPKTLAQLITLHNKKRGAGDSAAP